MDLDSIPWPGGDWQATLRLAGALIGGYLLVLWFASILWVYRDIQSRTRDPITQAIGVGISVVFPLVGLPVYWVVRPQETLQEAYDRQLEQEAILSELHSVTGCPNCRRPIGDDFMVCAYCGTALKAPCNSCGRLLQFSWRVCPTCATPKPRPQPDPAEVARREAATSERRRAPQPQAAARSSNGGANGGGSRSGSPSRPQHAAASKAASNEEAAPVRPRARRMTEDE